MRAFLSYQTQDKLVAGRVREVLQAIGVQSFLAHEDIQVSRQWQRAILDELKKCELFFAILSERYYQSIYCAQESGIAVFRDMTIVPLSIDGTIPKGFIAHIQSSKVDPEDISPAILFAGIAEHDFNFVFDRLVHEISTSGSFRGAEYDFQQILPYLDRASDEQIVRLLNTSSENGQVLYAHLVVTDYLPPLFARSGHLLDEDTRNRIEGVLNPKPRR